MADPADEQRRAAAERAADFVRDGMTLGFGTGRAAGHVLRALAARRLRVQGVPSSRPTEELARSLGLALTTLDEHPRLDLTLDGADEVSPALHLLKGGGGALLREKVLAAASDQLVIVVESRKLVTRLGTTRGVPLEVLPFAAAACLRHLRERGGEPALRRTAGGAWHVTANGNWVIDCAFPAEVMADPPGLDVRLRSIPGVLETGIFHGFQPTVVVGSPSGVQLRSSGAS